MYAPLQSPQNNWGSYGEKDSFNIFELSTNKDGGEMLKHLEYYHPSEVHPHTSAICMHTMFEQAPISGLAITCMKTVLEHGCFNVIPLCLFGTALNNLS